MLKFFSIASRNGLLPMRNLLSAQASAPQFASKRFVSSEGSGKELSESAQPSSAEIEPFDFKPSRPEMVLILRNLAKKLEAGKTDFIPQGNLHEIKIPTPSCGYWRKQGFVSFFVEAKPRSDGLREIEMEIKWSDEAGKATKEAGNVQFADFNIFLRSLANTLNSGGPKTLQAGKARIDVPSTHGSELDLTVEYEREDDGTHELEIKVAY